MALGVWVWGLAGAAAAGAILAILSRHQPSGPRQQGWRLGATLAWEGVVYGSTEGLLLSVLPVLVTWQAFAAHGWTSGTGRILVAGTAALAASLAVIVIHHLGYRGFRDPAVLGTVMVGCGLLSLAYLLTASPLAAVVGHIIVHTALNLRGTEMPPYATGVPTWSPSASNGQQPRRARRPPRSAEEVREPRNHRGNVRTPGPPGVAAGGGTVRADSPSGSRGLGRSALAPGCVPK